MHTDVSRTLEDRFHADWLEFVLSRRERATAEYRGMEERLAAGHAKYGGKVLRTFFHPYVASAAALSRMAEAAEAVAAILEKAARLYLQDEAVRRQFRVDPRVEELILHGPERMRASPAAPVLRFDSFVEGESVRFLEANTDGSSGMNDTNEIEARFLECPLVAEFQSQWRLRMLPMLGRVLETLLEAWRQWGGDAGRSPAIGIVDWRGVKTEEEFFALQEHFESEGVRTLVVDPRELRLDAGRLRAPDGTAIDLVYKRVLTAELLSRWSEVQPLIEGYRAGAFCQVGSYLGEILYDKGVLALLSDPASAGYFSATERAAIARHVPWTRRVRPGAADYENDRVELTDLLRRNRERFVIKPATAYGGAGVRIGRECGEAAWERALQAAATEDLIAQEHVAIPEERFAQLDAGAAAAKKVNVGQFVFGGRFGGLYCRVSDASIINVSSGGATLPCFEVTPAS